MTVAGIEGDHLSGIKLHTGLLMNTLRSIITLGLATTLIACGDETGLEAVDLQGTWSASVYEYTDNSDSQNVVDLIQRDGATFTMVVDASGTVATELDDGVGGTSSDSGTFNSTGSTLTLSGTTFNASRSGDRLTLTNPQDEFDFGTGSVVPATLRIVLNRQ